MSKHFRDLNEVRSGLQELLERIPDPAVGETKDHQDVEIIFVAVHGIGDQFRFETIQSVAHRVCDYVGEPAAIPIGRYHGDEVTITGAYLPAPPNDPNVRCAFAEIYWADVPREQAADRYILEESKKWARTLVERLELRARQEVRRCANEAAGIRAKKQEAMSDSVDQVVADIIERWKRQTRHQNALLEQVIEELIEGVIIADRLAFLAEKAGLFKFELKSLLADYLGDVQVFTEFEKLRSKTLGGFERLMKLLVESHPRARIYIVAHSEGTVVAFLGLLTALKASSPWTARVHGLMTIGSPLNKHIRLWPELFDDIGRPDELMHPTQRIQWRNYFDYGDPIAFNLRPIRVWLEETGWNRFFEFQGPEHVEGRRLAREAGENAKEATCRAQEIRREMHTEAEEASGATEKAEANREPLNKAACEAEQQDHNAQEEEAIRKAEDASLTGNHAEAEHETRQTPKHAIHEANVAATEADLAVCLSNPVPATATAERLAGWAPRAVKRIAKAVGRRLSRRPANKPDLERSHDIGFTRYFFPGAAHLDYWRDPKVFGHFLSTVVDPLGKVLRPASHDTQTSLDPVCINAAIQANERRWRPEDIKAARFTSYALPYMVSVLLLFLGVFLLYKTVRACLDPRAAELESVFGVGRNVLGLTALIAGMSLLARIPRLTRKSSLTESVHRRRGALSALGWKMIACVLALLSLGYLAVSETNRRSIELILTSGRNSVDSPTSPAVVTGGAGAASSPAGALASRPAEAHQASIRLEWFMLAAFATLFLALLGLRHAPTPDRPGGRWAENLEHLRALKQDEIYVPKMLVLVPALACVMGVRPVKCIW